MADNIVLPAVPVLSEIDDSTKLLIEQAGEINRYPISDLDIGGGDVTIDLSSADSVDNSGNPINADTLGGKPASEYVTKDYLMLNDIDADTLGGINADQYVTKDMLNNSSVKLNFSVVGDTKEPTNRTENMIWVNTNTEITKVVFRSIEPSNPVEGMVCIYTGSGSNVSFDRMVVNGIGVDEVYPISAKQYVSGAWVDVAAKTYQGGKWIDWFTYFYNKGNEYTSLTGGWEFVKGSTSDIHSTGTGTKNSDSITLSMGDTSTGAAITSKTIDLTPFSTLEVNVTDLNSDYVVWFGAVTTKGDVVNNVAAQATLTEGVVSLNVSTLSDKYYIAVYLQTDPGHYNNFVTFDSVRAY